MKEDLLKLKSSFDTKKRYSQYIGGEGSIFDSLSMEQIITRDDSKEAVSYAEETLKYAICNLSNNDISFDKISISPVFSIFVDDDVINENGEIVDFKNGIIKDYVGIVFEPVRAFVDDTSMDVQSNPDSESVQVFCTRFSDFVVRLNECGYELSGISNFKDICYKILHDESAVGEILVSFEKEKFSEK